MNDRHNKKESTEQNIHDTALSQMECKGHSVVPELHDLGAERRTWVLHWTPTRSCHTLAHAKTVAEGATVIV